MECKHDYENPTRLWRAKYICPKCKEDITVALVYIHESLNYKNDILD